MAQSTPDAKFPLEVWDGLTSTTPDITTEKNPDIEFGNRYRAEIRAIEEWLLIYKPDLEVIHAYGDPGDALTVNSSGTGLEWSGTSVGTTKTILTNGNASSIVIGSPVYSDADGSVDLAQANATGTVEVIGLVQDVSIIAAASGIIQTGGVIAATTAQWDAITGDAGGLTAGSVYYLDASTAGKLTTTAPTIATQHVARVGQALSTTRMRIALEQPILL